MIDWHNLFGWTLTDYFRNSNYRVDFEKYLSIKPQRLDVVIVKKSDGQPIQELPDGLEDLSEHNLLSYKSLQEPMDTLAILELFGHYINYRKLLDIYKWQDLPLDAFRLFAIATRYPQKLNRELKNNSQKLTEIKQGVYDTKYGNQLVRVIVLSQLPPEKKNAVLHLFSGNPKGFQFGQENYQWRYPPAIATLRSLFKLYLTEGVNMDPNYEGFLQECIRDTLAIFPVEERLKGLPPKEVLEQFSVEDRLMGLPPEALEKQLAKLRQKSP
ncbi:MAG TPA: hypothetical protein ENG03_01230 [Thioploca sp.]|nr:MAG: hypothetical protein DRR19_24505 [Gammaproteobacteria bacterium]HDN25721.1 hypothetical protein [Thioploca sp.]